MRIWSDGLNNAKQLYKVEGISKYAGFTSIHIRPDHETIHEQGLKYITKLEESMEKEKDS